MDDNKIKFELKEDKIIDILLHSATREDINKLDARLDKLDAKIDATAKAAREDINKLDVRLDKLDAKIDATAKAAREDINKLDAKMDKLIYFILAAILVPIALHFIK